MLLRILLISAMLLIVAYSAVMAQEGEGYYHPEGGHCTVTELEGTVCGNEPVTQYDVTGWSWGCGAPEGEPELTHCEWTPTNNFPGRAQ